MSECIKPYDTYLFDLDGTLTDSSRIWLGIMRDGLADFDILNVNDAAIAQCTHDWKTLCTLGISLEAVPTFTTNAHVRAHERLPEAPLYDGALGMLRAIRRAGKKSGIFTTMDRPILEPVIEQHGLDQLVDVIVAGTDVEHRKPHPAGIYAALGELGIREQPFGSVVYAGDRDTDIQAAQNAHVDSLLFYPEANSSLYDAATLAQLHPTHTIQSWQELTDTLAIAA